jgi:hypothetical protein
VNLWQAIETEARARKLDFLVIGGHAVNQYGYSRETADVDLLARGTEREQWLQVFEALGYKLYSEKTTFLQLTAPPQFGWPVDLMFVSDDTWRKMSAEAKEVRFADAPCRVPKLQHLIAMKVHSLRHGHAHRFLKDFQDVVGLIDVSGIDVASPEIREIFQRHGTSNLYEKVARACSGD